MENKKEIGRAFKEKLSQLDRVPNDSLWEAIELDLDKKKKKRRIIFIPLWLKSIGILTLVGVFSWYTVQNYSDHFSFSVFSNDTKTIEKPSNNNIKLNNTTSTVNSTDSNNTTNGNNSENYNAQILQTKSLNNATLSLFQQITQHHFFTYNQKFEGFITKNSNGIAMKNPQKYFVLSNTKTQNKKGKNSVSKNSILQNNNNTNVAIIDEFENENTKTPLYSEFELKKDSINSKTDSLKTSPTEKIKIEPTTKDSIEPKFFNVKKISVFVYYSPTYTGLLSNNSPIDKRLNQNPITSSITPSYGLYIGYEATEKLSFRIGYNYTNTQITTENAIVNTPNYANIEYYQNYSNASIYSQSNFASTMSITQDISYTELPVEIQYYFSKSKFGFNVFTGFGFRILKINTVKVETDNGYQFTIGETKNLLNNAVNFNLGLGLDYKFTKKIKLNVEPIFKYHFMDYNNHSSIKPYTIGIQTGLQFNF